MPTMRRAAAHMAARDREEGQGLVEYAFILAFIAAVSITALTALGGPVTHAFDMIKNTI